MIKMKSNNSFKLHYDHGIFKKGNNKWNLYGSLNGTRSLDHLSFRLGAHLITNNYQSDNRIKIEPGISKDLNVTWYNRSVAEKGKWRFGMLGALKLNNRCLMKNNFFIGYQVNRKSSFFWRC